MEWSPIILTFQLAAVTTLILFFLATPIAYWLSVTTSRIKPVVETLVALPIVLPPTVLGFYLLIAFSPNSAAGQFLNNTFGIQLAFSFGGLVVASLIYSLPFMVQPIQSGFSNLSGSLIEASLTLGKSKFATLTKVLLPNIKPSILTGLVLTFAHTIGEFGVVLMIGGNIPDRTRVASIAIYNEVESLNYSAANSYAVFLLVVTFSVLLLVYSVNGGFLKKWMS
ncbi:MAG TPA: molybdate ABC transporter permease subunit [Cyclobacteriaceae bacterium]|nr:molybdate ABC transporter permease subunit [Cyclobacteriaceae bacterium]HRW99936.1 molybdate ABC transporter permease subunit [Cyclobacteriaceae bacterium]